VTVVEAQPAPAGASTEAVASRWGLTRLDLLIVAGLAVVAAVPRLTNLLGLDPFIDEASWTDWAIREFNPAVPRTWLAPLLQDGRPPLHFWLTLPLTLVVDNGLLAGRLAAALAGVASTLALYGLGRELVSRTVGGVAALLWALSPFTVFLARFAADDSVLALMAMLVCWSSVCLARRPSTRTAIMCGLTLGFGVLAKTTGVLFVLAPPLAVLFVGHPRAWRSYVRPFSIAALVSVIAMLPLAPWMPQIVTELGRHAASSSGDGPGSLLAQNSLLAGFWLYQFLGAGLPLLTAIGLVTALVWRERGLLLVTVLGAVWLGIVLDRGVSLFSRYLLFGTFPAFLLAGYAADRLALVVGWVTPALPPPSPLSRKRERGETTSPPPLPSGRGGGGEGAARRLGGEGRSFQLAAISMAVFAVVVAVWPRADLLRDVVLAPERAEIPSGEHFRYVEQWLAVHGLGQIVQELRQRGAERPVTVLVPPASREERVLVPYNILRAYLRHDPAVRFVEVPALYRAQDLRDLRRVSRDGPTYLLVNGTYTDAPGTPNDVPGFTRRLEDRLARDVPEAHAVLRIDRPSAPNWLTLYRLDPGD